MKGKFVRNLIAIVAIAVVAVLSACFPATTTYEPEIIGVQTKMTAYTGDAFDFLAGITAKDKLGNDATDKVEYFTAAPMDETGHLTQSGTYTVRYVLTIDGVAVTQVYSQLEVIYKKPDDDNKMISNGDFASGSTDPFILSQFENGTGAIKVENEELVVDVTNIAAAQASPRIDYNGLTLDPAKFYEVKFDARANVARQIHIQLGELISAAPWFKTVDPTDRFISLTTTMQTFSFRFQPSTAAGADMTKISLLFEFGRMKNNEAVLTSCFLDNITMQEVADLGTDTTAPTITAPATFTAYVGETLNIPVTAFDDFDKDITSRLEVSGDAIPVDGNGKLTTTGEYNVIYTVADNAGNDATVTVVVTVEGPRQYADPENLFGTPAAEVVCNAAGAGGEGNARNTHNQWHLWYVADPSWNEGQPATLLVPTYENGILTVVSTQGTNTNFWANQIFYSTLPFEEGGQFVLTVDINSTKAGQIVISGQQVDLVAGDNHFELTVTVAAGEYFFFSVQLGVVGTPLGDATLAFSNIHLNAKDNVQYADPQNLFGTPAAEVVCDALGTGKKDNSILNPSKWYLWYVADPSWNNGQPATLLVPTFENGILTVVSTQGTNTNFWANQIFYTTLPFEVGGEYKLSLTINSTKAGKITVAGKVVDLVVGNNTVEVLITVADKTAFTLEIALGDAATAPLGDATLTLSNVKIGEVNEEEITPLTTPEGAAANKNDTGVTFAWAPVANTTKYTVNIYNEANELVKTLSNVDNGVFKTFEELALDAGNYTVKVKALGDGINYSDSELSAASSAFAIDGGQAPVYADPNNLIGTLDASSLLNVGGNVVDENASKSNPGKFAIWYDQGGWIGAPATVTYTWDGTVLSIQAAQPAGSCWFATQVFYTTLPFEVGGDYELSLTINASVAGKITVNGTVVDLVQGDNTVKVKVTVAAKTAFTFSLQLGVSGVGNAGDMNVTLSNLHLGAWTSTEATQLAAPIGLVAQVINANTIFYAAWQGDLNAVSYKIFIFNASNEQVFVIENALNGLNKAVGEFSLPAGTYTAKLQAIGNGTTYLDSPLSEASTPFDLPVIEEEEPTDLTKLSTPVGLVAQPFGTSNFYAAWGGSANATSYKLYIYDSNSQEVKVIENAQTGLNVPYVDLGLTVGTYTAKLQAIGDGVTYADSDLSAPVSFTLA